MICMEIIWAQTELKIIWFILCKVVLLVILKIAKLSVKMILISIFLKLPHIKIWQQLELCFIAMETMEGKRKSEELTIQMENGKKEKVTMIMLNCQSV